MYEKIIIKKCKHRLIDIIGKSKKKEEFLVYLPKLIKRKVDKGN